MNKKPKEIEMSYLSGLTVSKDEAVSLVRAGREGARDASGWMISEWNQEETEKRRNAIGWSSLTSADGCERRRTFTTVRRQTLKMKRMRICFKTSASP